MCFYEGGNHDANSQKNLMTFLMLRGMSTKIKAGKAWEIG